MEKDKEELYGKVVDKMNQLNKIQIERMDSFKAILRHSCSDDLHYLIKILDNEIEDYSKGLKG